MSYNALLTVTFGRKKAIMLRITKIAFTSYVLCRCENNRDENRHKSFLLAEILVLMSDHLVLGKIRSLEAVKTVLKNYICMKLLHHHFLLGMSYF